LFLTLNALWRLSLRESKIHRVIFGGQGIEVQGWPLSERIENLGWGTMRAYTSVKKMLDEGQRGTEEW